jgi:hypothetical protein
MDDAGLPALLDAIRHLEGCAATWVESVPVHEKQGSETVWAGEVQVFDLADQPEGQARLCVVPRDNGGAPTVPRSASYSPRGRARDGGQDGCIR